MRLAISTRYALRSLARHPRRTILSVVGIGLGCAVCLFMIGFVRGEGEMLMRAAAESGAGHLRIVPAGWAEKREKTLRLPAWRETLEKLRADARIEVATPRARIDALLAFGSRLVGVEALGVDAATERAANRLVRNVVEGAYLSPGDAGTTVIGRAVATRLDIELDDEIMITVSGRDGEMKSAMLRVAGIVETGSRDLDASVCHMPLADLEALSGYAGAGEITVLVREPRELALLAESLAATLPPGSALMTWDALMPALAASVEVDETWSALTTGIIMIVVFLGIASAQLAAVMERRREFAVLAALGMKSGRLVRAMLAEGLVLGLLGGALGLAIGAPFSYLIAVKGIDFSGLYGEADLAISNVLIDPVIYGDFGWWLVPLAFALSLAAAGLSSLYPAWYATRTDPAAALRVDH